MKIKALFLVLFVAGVATSLAVAKPPPGHGKGKQDRSALTGTTTDGTTLPASGKVVLCHRTGKAGKWVRISVAAKAAKQRIGKGDVWLRDPALTCAAVAAPVSDDPVDEDPDEPVTTTAP